MGLREPTPQGPRHGNLGGMAGQGGAGRFEVARKQNPRGLSECQRWALMVLHAMAVVQMRGHCGHEIVGWSAIHKNTHTHEKRETPEGGASQWQWRVTESEGLERKNVVAWSHVVTCCIQTWRHLCSPSKFFQFQQSLKTHNCKTDSTLQC